jgi:hypothetical protein
MVDEKSEKTGTDALQKTGFDYQVLGKALVEKAEQDQQKQVQDAVVSGVQSILRDIAIQKATIEAAQHRITKQEWRIAALQAGQFTIDTVNACIQFQDATLNGDDFMARTVLHLPNLHR